MKKKTVIIGGVEYIDATKSEAISTIIGGFIVIIGLSALLATCLWTVAEVIVL